MSRALFNNQSKLVCEIMAICRKCLKMFEAAYRKNERGKSKKKGRKASASGQRNKPKNQKLIVGTAGLAASLKVIEIWEQCLWLYKHKTVKLNIKPA